MNLLICILIKKNHLVRIEIYLQQENLSMM